MRIATPHARSFATKIFPLAIVYLGGTGCVSQGAPSFALFGAYFPLWMFCAGIGIAGAIAARTVFVATGLAERLPFQLFVCTAIGVLVGLAAWLLWSGPIA